MDILVIIGYGFAALILAAVFIVIILYILQAAGIHIFPTSAPDDDSRRRNIQ